jgi:hypothetical protein
MKNLGLVIGIVMILALVCSPALAISKADLISQYKGQSSPTIPTPILTSTPTPTSTPTTITTSNPLPLCVNSTPSRANVFIDGSFRGSTPISIYDLCVGTHQIRVSWWGYEDYSTEVLIPERSPPHCHVTSYGLEYCELQDPILIDVTLKKIESTLKPTIPTIVPTKSSSSWWTRAAPIPATLTPDIFPWIVPPTTAPTPTPSHTPCPPGTPYSICFA